MKLGKKKFNIRALEKRLMLDASLGALVSSTVLAENTLNTTPQVLDGDVTITGATTDFSGESLTISSDGGAPDQLTITDEGAGAGQIGFDGANVTYGGVLIGTISSSGANGADLTIDLNVSASKAAIERLIENITYQNTSDTPTLSRIINVDLSNYFSENISVTIVAQNDALVVTTNTGLTAAEGGTTTITAADLNITDPDDIDSDIIFTTIVSPTRGQLELTGNVGVAITSFTLDDIVNNRVVYIHDDSETIADSFEFSVTDGDVTIAAQNFDITITGVNDPLSLDTNAGVTVFQNFSTTIGAEASQFGTQLLQYNSVGSFGTWNGTVDNKSLQYSLVFTTPGSNPNGIPGEVLFESGGTSQGLGLYLNSDMELDFYAGNSSITPRLSTNGLAAGTQYAVIVEIDQATDEIRIHYQEAGDFNWYQFGRSAENTRTGYSATNHVDSDTTGVGRLSSTNLAGGYNGTISGTTNFQGSLDSALTINEFPGSIVSNTILVANDPDTGAQNIIYTITTDVTNGSLYNNGIALALNNTFTQSDLDRGLITYTNTGGVADSFDFSVTDGTTILGGNSFAITVDTTNVAPEILNTTTIYSEDFEGGTSGWNNNTTTTEATLSEFAGRFNKNIHVADNQEFYQTFATSGTQDYITVEFDLYELDSWDNEYFYVFVNDTQILNNHRLKWSIFDSEVDGTTGNVSYTVQETTEVRGHIGFNASYYDQTYHYSLTIQSSDPTVKIGFGSSLNGTNVNDEAFGIDNILIQEVGSAGAGMQEFYLAEDAANNVVVGTLQSTDQNAGQVLSYSITGGTGAGIFSIDANTGIMSVLDNTTLDYETTTSYTLDMKVIDAGGLSDTQTITINIADVMENTASVIDAATFTISETAVNDDDVGTVTSTDAEGDTTTYTINSGNTGNVFKINATTGLIEINDASQLDYDAKSSYSLQIRSLDNNALGLYGYRTLTINITDVDEAPSLDIETIIETQNSGVLYSADTGNFYKNITSSKNYATALAYAETQFLNGEAGHLVTITSSAEYNFVRDYVSSSHIWIALSDEGEEGKWIITAGPEAGTQITQGNTDAVGTFNNWTGSEPNSGNTRNHALFNSNGWWYDNWPGTNSYHSTVEWEGADIINNSFYNVNHSNADASDVSNGDSVGFVQGIDPEGDTLDFSIQGGNGSGIFEIDAATGEVKILDNTNLDATVQDTYVLTIRATETNGIKFDEINITIKFNDDFTLSTNNTLSVIESASAVLTTAALNITDLDGVAADTVFHVTTLPANGQLEHTTNPGFQISTFTLDDLQNNRISFVHDGTETLSDSFVFSVTDGGDVSAGNTFNINITTVNDAPTIALNTGTNVLEGARVTIDNTMLDALDIDDAATGLTYTSSVLTNGHIEVSGATQNTFTQEDIDNSLVEFVHDGSEAATASFAFSLADGGENGAVPATGTFNLTVSAVNDSPTITTNTGAAVTEGAQVTITNAMLNGTDPDDSGAGLTYTLSNILNGQVELSTNPGAAIISFTQADLDANRVVFVHDGNENDSSFDISLADGGEDASTADTATFTLSRTPVNDSPIIAINAGSTINQNSIVFIKNAVLAASDPDDSGTGLTFTITGTTNGQLEFFANPNVAITTFTQDDIDNSRIIFRHNGPPGAADFDFTITDGGEDSAVSASGTFALTVDNVNDAPTIATNSGPTVDEASTTILTTAMLDSFDADDFGTELTWTASSLLNGIIQVNSVTQNTFTQADLDNGLVTFIHDGSETTTAGFDIQVADGGEDGAVPATGTFTMTVTPVNEAPTLIVNDGSPNVINFNDYTIDPTDVFQDGQGGSPTTSSVSVDGMTLTIGGNAWKKIDIPYTLTANTVLSFEFYSDDIGEIFGIGFDDDGDWNNGLNGYQLGGTQVWSGMDQSFRTYSQGDGWVRFDIPIGADFTGTMGTLAFILDDDASPTGEISFRNVNFYENGQILDVDEGANFTITNAHINSTDVDDAAADRNLTASNLSNGHIKVGGVVQNTFTQADINNGDVVFVHDGSETANAGFDISLADGGEDGAGADTGTFTLIVNPLNDAPTLATNTGATMNEGATLAITTAMLNEGDADDDGTNLTYIASNLSNGHIEVSGITKTTFTQDDIDQGRVTFVHDDSQTTSAAFDLSLADGGENAAAAATGTFNIVVTPVNDAPIITTNTGATLNEGATLTITTAMLNSSDVDDAIADRTYTASALTNGHIEVGGVVQNTFTQIDINNGDVDFIHDDSQTTTASFALSLADGGEDSAVAATGTFSMAITAMNDAPVIATNTGATMDEGTSLIITTAMLNEGDLDDSGTGLTYTASALSNGHIEVGGVTQTTFTQADIDNGDVAFIHDGSETMTAAFNISLADGGENGAVAATGTFNITVTPVSDAPIIVNNAAGTVTEGGATFFSNAQLSATDIDNVDANLLYTISALPAGLIENTNTASILTTGSIFTQGDIGNGFIRYTHDGGEGSTQSLRLTISDGTTTLAPIDFTWNVTAVNDDPTAITISETLVEENSDLGTIIGDLGTMDVDLPGDSFTYSIVNDPDNMFALNAHQLVVNGNLDFESAETHSITIRSDDGNGGTIDQIITIDISDLNETSFVPLLGNKAPISGFDGFVVEEDKRLKPQTESLIQASLSGNEFMQLNAFYGEEGITQILREKTTLEIQGMPKGQNIPEPNNPLQEISTPEADQAPNENDGALQEKYTNIREILKSLEQFAEEESEEETAGEEDSGKEYHNLYSQFEDVLSYHEQCKEKIRTALLS